MNTAHSLIRPGLRFARAAARLLRPAACVFLLIVISVGTVSAMPLAEYRKRVDDATLALDSLLLGDEETSDRDGSSTEQPTDKEIIAYVRTRLAPTETVVWQGGTINVDNLWLHQSLDAYVKNAGATGAERQAMLRRIADRLGALRERLAALSSDAKAESPPPASKEEARARLANILRQGEYHERTASGGALSNLLRQVREWLRSLLPRSAPAGAKPVTLSGFSRPAQVVVIVLLLLALVFVLWRLAPLLSRLSKREGFAKIFARDSRVVLGERLKATDTAANLLAEAERLARDGQVRAAIRKAYIALLCDLGDRKVLRLAENRTNRDYLYAVRNRAALFAQMQLLTASFERHWYGREPASEEHWTDFSARYHQAVAATRAD